MSLRLEKRARPDDPPELKRAARSTVAHLTQYPQFPDWRELVPEHNVGEVAPTLSDTSGALEKPKSPNRRLLLPPPALYFDRPVSAVLTMFRTSLGNGLPSSAIPDLQDHYGRNSLPAPPKPSTLKMLVKQLTDFMVLILLAATITTAVMGETDSSIVLAVVIVLNTVIGFTQEYKANKAMEALSSLDVPMAQVIRDGQTEMVESATLVPGDVVILEEGQAVPADLRLVEVSQLEIVESILTGESVGVQKSVERIRAKIGKISRAITHQPQQVTQIQRKLALLGKWLVGIALGLCVVIVVIGLAWKQEAAHMIEIGIALAVSVIPEGLVAVVTVTMALGVRRMAAENAIVRSLPSVETLGSVNVICSDKVDVRKITGTLTEGKMGAAQVWTTDDSLYTFSNSTSMDPNVGGVLRASARASVIHPDVSHKKEGALAADE
ncbi:MAG: hypothetical protein BJ554DRAFT_7740, partial [Olpidium bornovanus]